MEQTRENDGKIVTLSEMRILKDKARRIVEHERKKNPDIMVYPTNELIDVAWFLVEKKEKR
jgi:hypothetical protein